MENNIKEWEEDLGVPVYVSNEDGTGALITAAVFEDAVEAYADEIYEDFGYMVFMPGCGCIIEANVCDAMNIVMLLPYP